MSSGPPKMPSEFARIYGDDHDGPVKPVKTVDYNDPEVLIRRWAIEQAQHLSTVGDAKDLIEAATAIEAYVKGDK